MLQVARQKRQAWKEALANNEVRSDDYLAFLNIMSRPSNAGHFDTATAQAGVGTSRCPGLISHTPILSSNRYKAGPTYSFYVPTTPVIVQGRALGRVRVSSNFIGVCGIVASLPHLTHSNPQNISKSLQPYYVVKAEFGPDGRPDVVVSYTPPPPDPGNWLSGTFGSRHSSLYGAGRLSQTTPVTDREPSNGNVGRKVINRVHVLLEDRGKAVSSQ